MRQSSVLWHIHCPLWPTSLTKLGKGGLHCYPVWAKFSFLPNCHLRAHWFFSLLSYTLSFSFKSLSCCYYLNAFRPVCVFPFIVVHGFSSHPFLSLSNSFIIKLSQDHTTALHQMRSEVTGWSYSMLPLELGVSVNTYSLNTFSAMWRPRARITNE